ncbi:malto-oligosyltrehalose trehalohydrolase [Piscinibacter sp. XHJ-5]|uniref:malto-oligosyltrehalose trehalohydrolase n=1 Tax=Piscinibacter sp. XHJ-5 TaxID=3037797 RepID=UPI002452DD9E|nr:malto-oligosyltrehalose trehalohydrolase [Piscinibacter sp. XHJ-5]
MRRRHAMPFGAELQAGAGVRFRLWAPSAEAITLRLHVDGGLREHPMQRLDGGWHACSVDEAGAGTRYDFVTPGGLAVPDPASRSNPDDVHSASQVVDPQAHDWRDDGWTGRPWHEAVIYELHVGTFTDAGTFAAAAERLGTLAALGVTAIELMPVADFPGRRGWGYDGVLLFAPESAYGTPEDLKRLVEAAHGHGLMVLLDVVYNHFGPEGNYLHAYCPEFFNAAHATPWGAAINFDGAANRTVRDFYVHNALYWIEEFHFDGLRLDAVHAIRDDSAIHIACEIAEALAAGPGRERHVHVVLENDANESRFLLRDASGRPRHADAQWNDDFHHAAHVLATGEADGYYADYADAPIARFGRALAEGFVYQGDPSAFRDGEPRGEPSAHLPGTAFVSFLQNHDQIGNRAFGERLGPPAVQPDRLEMLLACLLLSPHVPMLFMGEEYGASSPFLYFCDFGPELASAVAKGRREEFRRFAAFRDEAARARIPDPNDESTFRASVLKWSEREAPPHAARRALVQQLLALRSQWLVPRLAGMSAGGQYRVDGTLLQVRWPLADGAGWHLAANFGAAPAEPPRRGHVVFERCADGPRLRGDGVRIALERAGG